MKKLIFAALAFAMSVYAQARPVEVESVRKIDLPEGVACQIPTISPDGKFAVVGVMGMGALHKVDLSNGEVSLITENGDADALKISPDGKNIVFRKVSFDNNKMRFTALNKIELETRNETELVKPSRRLNAGFAVTNKAVTAIESGNTRKVAIAENGSEASMPVASISYGDLQVTVDGMTATINPQGDGSYLWPSVSPDGTKVAYYLVGVGAFVCDLDGRNVMPLGFFRAPAWLSNDMIVGMEDFDDGRAVTESTIATYDLDGNRQALTSASLKGMYPSASADGSKIVFATDDGDLYLITLKK